MMQYTIKNIVQEYLIEIGDNQFNRYARFYQLAVSGMREFHYDMVGVLKTVELPINSNDTVNLPVDYINYATIGISGADGRIHSLARNESLSLRKQYDSCGNEVKATNSNFIGQNFTVNVFPQEYAAHWRNGQMEGRFYGAGGVNNSNGYFKINKTDHTILLSEVNCKIGFITME